MKQYEYNKSQGKELMCAEWSVLQLNNLGHLPKVSKKCVSVAAHNYFVCL